MRGPDQQHTGAFGLLDVDVDAVVQLRGRRGSHDRPVRRGEELEGPAGRQFAVTSGPDGTAVGTYTSAQLQAGIDVTIPQAEGTRVLLVSPAP